MNLKPLLDFATELAFDAGRLTLGYFGRSAESLGLERKADPEGYVKKVDALVAAAQKG